MGKTRLKKRIGVLTAIVVLLIICVLFILRQDTTEYDTGVFENQSMEETLQCIRPTAVQLYLDMGGGAYTTASGFLIEISEENIYICTNRHVTEGYEDWQVYFYDGTKVQGKNIGMSDQYDVSVVAVAVADVPSEVLRELRTVHIDMNHWLEIGNEQFEVGLLRVDQKGDVLYILEGMMLRKETNFPWGNGMPETELDIAQTDGDSGSALFDKCGNLIAMVHGNSEDIGGVRNWAIPLSGIISSYEEITGRTLEVNR